jgi:hypothetical protein
MSTNQEHSRNALYYPFHLCHVRTLEQLLVRFDTIHFMDYMALRLNRFSGTTAYFDRMGDAFPDLVKSGRLVQGHQVSGSLSQEARAAINEDLADPEWRALFHRGLREDRRFQRGQWDFSHAVKIGPELIPGPAALLALLEERFQKEQISIEQLQQADGIPRSLEEGYRLEYSLALVKTAAALHHTKRLMHQLQVAAVTDSRIHYNLMDRSFRRTGKALENILIPRQDY